MKDGKVLVVDDEECVREIVEEILSDNQIPFILANNGESGIEQYRTHQSEISIVLLDVTMPGMSGKETCTRILEINPSAIIILSSGYAEDDILDEFKDLNVSGFIKKPYRWNEFFDHLMKYAQ